MGEFISYFSLAWHFKDQIEEHKIAIKIQIQFDLHVKAPVVQKPVLTWVFVTLNTKHSHCFHSLKAAKFKMQDIKKKFTGTHNLQL